MSDRWVVGNTGRLAAEPIEGEGIKGVGERVLVSPQHGWDGWSMSLFDLAPGGHTPKHTHGSPHVAFVVSGSGVLELDGEAHPLEAGSYAFVPAGREHQFRASEGAPLSYVSIQPVRVDG